MVVKDNVHRAKARVVGLIIALAVIVFVVVLTGLASLEQKKTVTVVRVKADQPISSNALITEAMVEPYDMYYKEFKQYGTQKFSDGSTRSVLVRWGDRDQVVGKRYSAYYLRQGSLLFYDQTIAQQTKKNSYLYSMGGELLNIKLSSKDDFGDMVVPGDMLNIRVSYEKERYDLTEEEVYKLRLENGQSGDSGAVTETVTELLFSEVPILDMLNSEGESVFDVYYDFISSSKQEQQAKLQDQGFLKKVEPVSILVEATSEEADRFMMISAKSPKFLITLLPRTSSSAIIDSLSDIQEALRKVNKAQ